MHVSKVQTMYRSVLSQTLLLFAEKGQFGGPGAGASKSKRRSAAPGEAEGGGEKNQRG